MQNNEFSNRLDRREFLGLTTSTLATVLGALGPALARSASPIEAIAFDALAVFDPRRVFHLVAGQFP